MRQVPRCSANELGANLFTREIGGGGFTVGYEALLHPKSRGTNLHPSLSRFDMVVGQEALGPIQAK